MKKHVFLYLLLAFAIIGCTAAEKDTAADTIETTTKIVETVADVAGAAGVPFAEPLGLLVTFLGTAALGLLGRGSQKRKKEALYQSTADIGTAIDKIVGGIKNKDLSLEEVGNLLPGLVKNVSATTHTAYNVYKEIEVDINKYQKKGKIQKLS